MNGACVCVWSARARSGLNYANQEEGTGMGMGMETGIGAVTVVVVVSRSEGVKSKGGRKGNARTFWSEGRRKVSEKMGSVSMVEVEMWENSSPEVLEGVVNAGVE